MAINPVKIKNLSINFCLSVGGFAFIISALCVIFFCINIIYFQAGVLKISCHPENKSLLKILKFPNVTQSFLSIMNEAFEKLIKFIRNFNQQIVKKNRCNTQIQEGIRKTSSQFYHLISIKIFRNFNIFIVLKKYLNICF